MWSPTRSVVLALVLLLRITSLHPPVTALTWRASPAASATLEDNEELSRLHAEDQADRAPGVTDWSIVAAISKGKNDKETLWLAASSEDRFLMHVGRPQRFGTQFRSEGDGPLRLYPVGAGVTDELRRLMGPTT